MNQFVFEKRQFTGISLDDSMRRRDLSDGCFYVLQKPSVLRNARNIGLLETPLFPPPSAERRNHAYAQSAPLVFLACKVFSGTLAF